jgi:hypothetical protein
MGKDMKPWRLAMQAEIPLPNNATEFIDYMNMVWMMMVEPSEPFEDGTRGVILRGHPLYDRDSDARDMARRCGMYRTGGTLVWGEHWQVYRFPGHPDGICIRKDGNAIAPTKRRWQNKVKGA